MPTILQLPAADHVDPQDVFPGVQGGITKQFTGGMLGAGGAAPYDFQFFRWQMPAPPEPLISLVMCRPISFATGLPHAHVSCKVAPSKNYVITLYKEGVEIGLFTILAGQNVGTIMFPAEIVIAEGQIFEILPPALDTAIRGVRYAIPTTR